MINVYIYISQSALEINMFAAIIHAALYYLPVCFCVLVWNFWAPFRSSDNSSRTEYATGLFCFSVEFIIKDTSKVPVLSLLKYVQKYS